MKKSVLRTVVVMTVLLAAVASVHAQIPVINPIPTSTPDGGTTSLLLAAGAAGIGFLRRFMR